MKRIIRIIVFSLLALYLTSLWNNGFGYPSDFVSFFKSGIIIAIVFYLILPLAKLILLPINVLTLGFGSMIVYFAILHFLSTYGIITVKPWDFYGIDFYAVHIPKFLISYPVNLFLSSLSISTIINLLENAI